MSPEPAYSAQMTVIRMMVMEYKSIRQTLAMSSSTAKPKDAAEEEYQKRLNGYSTYRSGIEFEGHEMFAVAFRELLNVTRFVRGMEVQVESLWAALPPIARRAYLMKLYRRGNAEHELHRSRAHHAQGNPRRVGCGGSGPGRTSG